ncbi:MAG: hypothetical protein AAFS13_04090 [Pseudomonadota bacterium]
MKRVHRRIHVGIWLLVAPAMAAMIWLAVSLRPSPTVNPSLPAPLIEETASVP